MHKFKHIYSLFSSLEKFKIPFNRQLKTNEELHFKKYKSLSLSLSLSLVIKFYNYEYIFMVRFLLYFGLSSRKLFKIKWLILSEYFLVKIYLKRKKKGYLFHKTISISIIDNTTIDKIITKKILEKLEY